MGKYIRFFDDYISTLAIFVVKWGGKTFCLADSFIA